MKTDPKRQFEQPPDPEAMPTAALLLSSLEAAHQAVTDCLDKLERLVAEAGPGATALSSARLMLSQASYARRHVVQRACSYLAAHANPDELRLIRWLQSNEVAYVRESTAHVQRWSASAAIGDWASYQDASRAMRAKLREAIRAEQNLLYPLLSQCRP